MVWPRRWGQQQQHLPQVLPAEHGAGPTLECANLYTRSLYKTEVFSFTLPKGNIVTSLKPGFLPEDVLQTQLHSEARGTHMCRDGDTSVIPP